MRMLRVCVLVFAVTALTQAASKSHLVKKPLTCPGGWTLFSGRCFRYIPTNMGWTSAEKNCLTMGANLASVHNIEEYRAIQRLINTTTQDSKETWIGGTDVAEENFWMWTDGSRFNYTYWCAGEPNNRCHQHCLQMNYGASKCWDDLKCTAHRPSVCALRI